MKIACYILAAAIGLASCSKDDYYEDSGTHPTTYEGTVLEYLQANPFHFDTLTNIISLAGMEDVFNNQTITFFAPPNPMFKTALENLNAYLYANGLDSVTHFNQIKPVVWRTLLSDYIIEGDYGVNSIPQVDTLNLQAFGGQTFQTLSGDRINVGLFYHDYVNGDVSVKYGGYRQLLLSYVPDYSQPRERWHNIFVASSNISPRNGKVHVLNYRNQTFGYTSERFINLVVENEIDY